MSKIYLFLFLVVLFGCKDEEPTFQKINYDGQGEVISLPLPESALPTTSCLKAARFGGQDILYYYNSAKRQILMYDIDSEELIHTMQLYRQGPNEVNGIKGFTIIDRNHIMISTSDQNLVTVNLAGKVVDKIDYHLTNENNQFSRAIALNSPDNNDIYLTEGAYLIPQEPPYRNPDGVVMTKQDQTRFSVCIKVQGEQKEFCNIKLPAEAFEDLHQNSILLLTSTFVNGTFYWAFRTDMDIYYSSDLEHIKKQEIPNPVPRDSRNPQSLGMYGYTAGMTMYQSLLYDPYRKKFYRMVRYGVDNPDEMYGQDIRYVSRYPVNFSIFVMDKDLNPEKELHFEGTKYDFNRYFISSDGFYLSLNNPENPDFDENFLRFERIEL